MKAGLHLRVLLFTRAEIRYSVDKGSKSSYNMYITILYRRNAHNYEKL